MDNVKDKTDSICERAAELFRQRQHLERQIAALDHELKATRNAYRESSRVYGVTIDHLRQACSLRGML